MVRVGSGARAFALVALLAVTGSASGPFVDPVEAQAPASKAPSGTYVMDLNHASLIWEVRHFGLSKYPARFNKLEGMLSYDAEEPAKSSVIATVDVRSLRTGYTGTDKSFEDELTSAMVLDAAQYPTITFKSTAVTRNGANTGKVIGNLSFHGVTKPVVLDVVFNGGLAKHPFTDKPVVGFSAVGTIKRSDFGVDYLVGPISDEVTIRIEAEFQKQG